MNNGLFKACEVSDLEKEFSELYKSNIAYKLHNITNLSPYYFTGSVIHPLFNFNTIVPAEVAIVHRNHYECSLFGHVRTISFEKDPK